MQIFFFQIFFNVFVLNWRFTLIDQVYLFGDDGNDGDNVMLGKQDGD